MADTFKQHHLTVTPGNAVLMLPEALSDIANYDHKLDIFSYGNHSMAVLTFISSQTKWPVPKVQCFPSTSSFQKGSYDLTQNLIDQNTSQQITSGDPFYLF